MNSPYSLWDEKHCEIHGHFETLQEAMQELRQRATIPWDEPPNRAPCRSWRSCGREYYLRVTRPGSAGPERISAMTISADGIVWYKNLLPDEISHKENR